MFLQYMVWGTWYPVLSAYMERIGFSGNQIGVIYSLLPLGCMIAPLAAGQLADRYQKVFLVPCALTLLCAAAFFIVFKDRRAVAMMGAGGQSNAN